METRSEILRHLKVHGPCSVRELVAAMGVSANAVRHHLARLRSEGFVRETTRRKGVGRPETLFELTLSAEGAFPKRYHELLELVLEQAEDEGALERLLDRVASHLAEQLHPSLERLAPKARLDALMEQLDYGEMLGHLEETAGGWEFKAYNCVYRDTGCRFEPVCELLPTIIHRSTMLPAERLVCQRDGERYCHFAGGLTPE